MAKRPSLGFILAFGLSALSYMPNAYAEYSETELKAAQTSDEVKIRDIRNQEISELRIALGRRNPVNRRADLYLRLAEVDLEAYRFEYILEGRVHEKHLAKGGSETGIDHAHSKPYLMAGIKACNEILSFGIPYPKVDQVYYFLGINYGELGDRPESLKYFSMIIQKTPDSIYVSEAYRELADNAYEHVEYRKALGLYEQAQKKASPEIKPRVLHKLAWCYYRTKQYDRAVETMKEAITESQKGGEKFLSLQEEALRDMALFMTEGGKVEEAISYFQGVAKEKDFYPKALERLGKQYERNVEPAKATMVYESLLKTNPDSEAAFRVLVKLVDLDLRRNRYKEALDRLQAIKLPKGGEGETQVALQNLKAMVRRTATEHHEIFRRSGDKKALEIADDYYQAYIEKFLTREDGRNELPEIQMYLAEVKRDSGKSKEASQLYKKVVDSGDKRYAKEAGALWTASLAEAIKKSGDSAKSTEPSDLEKQYIDAADALQENLGDTNEGRESALKAAQVLAGYKATQKNAIKRIKKLITQAPKSPQAQTGARLWIQILSEDPAQSADLKDALAQIRQNQPLLQADQETGGSKLKAILGEEETHQKISKIAKEEKEQNFGAAGKDYENFASETNPPAVVEKALANSMLAYGKANDAESLNRVSDTWLKKFPKSPKAIDSIRSVATELLISGHFETSGALFEKLGKRGEDPDSLETAARLFEGDGQTNRAQQIWLAHLSLYPKSPHYGSILLQLAKSLLAAERVTEALDTFENCAAHVPALSSECFARIADYYKKMGALDKAKIYYRKSAGQTQGIPGEGIPVFVSYSRYQLALIMEKETKFEPLEFPEEKLKKGLNQRLQFLEPLSKAYLSAVESGGPWAVAALNRQATWAYEFASEIDRIAPPATLDPKAVEQFKKNLSSISTPLRTKSVSTWSEAYKKAIESELLSPVVPELCDQLSNARFAYPGRAQGYRGKLRLAGIPVDGGSEGKIPAMTRVRAKLTQNPLDAPAWIDYGNLLWGIEKPLLAKLAYERSLSINQKSVAALNNRGVVGINSTSEESWLDVADGNQLFKGALERDPAFLPAQMNRAILFNYYRLFAKAKPIWDKVIKRGNAVEVQDALGVSFQGLGNFKDAELSFKKGTAMGGLVTRFTNAYHEAARNQAKRTEGSYQLCLANLAQIKDGSLSGFEKTSFDNLKRSCGTWKSTR